MTASPLARAICCEGAPCMRPDSCDAAREYRVPISPARAAAAVERLLCERWAQTRARGALEAPPAAFGGASGSPAHESVDNALNLGHKDV
jgi:hypothetical protein